MTSDQLIVPSDWLQSIVDADGIAAELRRVEPELAESLVGCKVRRMRLDGTGNACTGSVLLTIRADDGSMSSVALDASVRPPGTGDLDETTDVTGGPFGSQHWQRHLPTLGLTLTAAAPERELAAYGDLVNAAGAPGLLNAALQTGTRAEDDVVIETAEPTVMRYKRGSRCTVRYVLTTSGQDADRFPDIIVAKTHHGSKGQIAHDAMSALWASPLRASGTVSIAEPLGFDAARSVLLQGPLPEQTTLKSLAVRAIDDPDPDLRDRVSELVRRAGRAAAELHGCGLRPIDEVGIDNELAEIAGRIERVRAWSPGPARWLAQLLDRATELAHATPQERAVPAHRSLRPAQFLIAGDAFGLIDFDGFCMAEPAIDLALFTVVLRSLAVHVGDGSSTDTARQQSGDLAARLAIADELCGAFLDGYRTLTPIVAARVSAWEAAYLMSMLLGSWTKLKLNRVPACLRLIDHHAIHNGLPDTSTLLG